MKLLRYEFIKALIGQKGALLIALFLVIKLVVLSGNTVPTNFLAPREEAILKDYLSFLSGELDGEKEAYILNEETLISQAGDTIDKAISDYSDGKISSDEFYDILEKQSESTEKKKPYDILKNKYLYANGDRDNRYLVYTHGWNALITDSDLDFVIVLLLILLTVPAFAKEYANGTYNIIFPTRKGRGNVATAKVACAFLLTIAVGILFFAAEYLFAGIKYGLPNGNYPIQSLPYYFSSPYKLSLFGAFLCVCAIKMLGYFAFVGVIMLLSVLFKKYLPSMFVSAAIVIIPYILLKDSPKIYTIAFPTGLFMGKGYLLGEGHIVPPNPEDSLCALITEGVSPSMLIAYVTGFALLTLVLVLGTSYIYCNPHRKFSIRRRAS